MFSKVIILGNSPASTICSIYLHTANKKHLVLRADCGLKFKTTHVAGVEDPSSFNEDCFKQLEHMEIEVHEEQIVSILKEGNYKIKTEAGNEYECEFLVVDKNNFGLEEDKNLFIVEERLSMGEGIEVAGEGCKIAFAIKDLLE